MRWHKKLGAALAVSCLVMGATAAQAETWRFALEEIKGSVQYEYAAQFAKMMKEKTDGEVEVKLYPYGEVGGLTDIYDAVQGGAVQLAFGSGFLGGTVPESQLFSLNFILSDDEWVNAQAVNSDAFLQSDAFQGAFNDRGLEPLSVVIEGWQVWTANREIHTPKDMDGLAIRTMDNRLLRETYQAYGASPVTIEYGELYSALQLGQAEGNIQPVFAHEEMGFYEVQDYMVFANQAEFIATFMANKEWYDGLSDDMKKTVDEVTDDLVKYIHDEQQKLNEKRLGIIKDKSDIKVIELSKEQRAQFRELSIPVRDTFVEMVGDRGQKLLDLVTQQVEKMQKQSGGGSSDSGGM